MNQIDNLDPKEITKFEQMASTWWDPEGSFKPIHRLNPLRLAYILDHSVGLFGKSVLDIGCGGGILSESMAKQGARVTGIDMGNDPLMIAKLHALESKLTIDYQQSTAEQFAKHHPEQYDVITCMEMLEHVPDPRSVIQACGQLLKPNGHLFLSTINRNFKAWLTLIVGAEYILKMLPKGTHDAKKFIRPSELIQWVAEAQLSAMHINGFSYNPLSHQFKLTKSIDTNYILHIQKRVDD